MTILRRLDARADGFEAEFTAFLSRKDEGAANVDEAVAEILADVKRRGDAAVLDYTNRFDRVNFTVSDLRVSEAEIASATCDVGVEEALKLAAERIEAYHRKQMPQDTSYTDELGVTLGWRWRAVESAGLYVPGGTACYPSSVLMGAIPAAVAGVERRVMVVPTPDGVLNPVLLVAARLAGITEVYRVGGAQAIGALAYGTETIAPVDVIVGPGNAYVASAKRQVFGRVGIDMIAGPSDITVVSDAQSDPAWIAADLLSQAEHDTMAQAVLITDDEAFAAAVEVELERQVALLPREAIARQSLEDHGAIIAVENLGAEAPGLVDRLAPEHLELAVNDPQAMAATIRHAGAIFLGRHTPEVLGDYVAGPSHTLPTEGTARFSSGLSVFDFLTRSSMMQANPTALEVLGPPSVTLAQAEGLEAHARSMAVRIKPSSS